MIDLFLIATLAAQPPPPPRKPGDERRDASAKVSQAATLTPSQRPKRIERTLTIMPNTDYIADHICRIEGIHANHPDRALKSKWRIASNADLFPTLASDGTLTAEQISRVDGFIAQFKQQHPDAIAKYARRAS
ncbi:MAG: hypothetical protein AB1861_29440 [Cyanobacteriota bacterium]